MTTLADQPKWRVVPGVGPHRHGNLLRRAGVHSTGWGSAAMSMPDRVGASQRRHRWAGYPIAVL